MFIRILPPDDLLARYKQLATGEFRDAVVKRYRQDAQNASRRILRVVDYIPERYGFGITRLMTPRQRRAFWASDGFGVGIPTERTDEYVNSFETHMETAGFGGFVVLQNTDPDAEFIGGDRQQPFHEGRWPLIRDLANRAADVSTQILLEHIDDLSHKMPGLE